MNYEKIQSICDSKSTITGKIVRLDQKNQRFIVDLGNNLSGIMSFSDSTIYPIYVEEKKDFSVYIYNLQSKVIRCKILSFDGSRIYLSRKENMLEALEILKNKTEFEAVVDGYTKFSAFFDVGAGIVGRSLFKEFSPVRYSDIKEVCVNYGEIIPVKVIKFSDDFNSFEVSRVKALPLACDIFKSGEIVSTKIFDSLPTIGGTFAYYALVNNTHCGIVNSRKKLNYGDKVLCLLNSVKENKLKLTFWKME